MYSEFSFINEDFQATLYECQIIHVKARDVKYQGKKIFIIYTSISNALSKYCPKARR